MSTYSFSDNAREKGVNQGFLERITSPFGRAVGAAMMAGTMLATPMGASAQSTLNGAPVHNASVSTQEIVNPDYENFKVFSGTPENPSNLHPKQVIRRGAARASDDRISVTIYGARSGDKLSVDALEMVRLSIVEAQKDGTEVVLVLGTSDPTQFDIGDYKSLTNPIHVEVHQNGGLVNTGDYFITPYIPHPDDGQLMLNTNFAQQMDDLFDLSKSRLKITLAQEQKVAMASPSAYHK